jgi:hypothetical protein
LTAGRVPARTERGFREKEAEMIRGSLMAAAVRAASGAARGQGQLITFKEDYVPPIAIPDVGTVSAPLLVPPAPPGLVIADIDIDFVIPHTWQGDLRISVVHPDGTTVTLVDRPGVPQTVFGFSADDYGGPNGKFISDDEAPMVYGPPGVPAPGIPGVAGAWMPESPLAALDGKPIDGLWKLLVEDFAAGDIGVIENFSLHITVIPAPACLVLACLGGMGALRRRR